MLAVQAFRGEFREAILRYVEDNRPLEWKALKVVISNQCIRAVMGVMMGLRQELVQTKMSLGALEGLARSHPEEQSALRVALEHQSQLVEQLRCLGF
ncbi:hypothetical protein NDU88_005244 [Pleurodeles waltl]|uniref:Uncharacterized protein n=1 Tax=Pleurodeles waltl TaxID=8319 RepID=A0AAV7WY41_PLEWA|nr:hypothetical protein NDU88_005244 [Pleurodeles waltl]